MAFIRRIKKGKSVYLAEVESYRQDGKVKQRVIQYLGKEVEGKLVKKKTSNDFEVTKVTQFIDCLAINELAEQLEIPAFLGKKPKQIMILILSHLLEKVSIYKVPEWVETTEILKILNLKQVRSKDLYEALQHLSELDFDIIQRSILKKFKEYENDSMSAVIDITDTYFNGSQADWKSRRGKDGKYNKLIQLALAVSFNHGFPIMHKVYEGNINNVKIFEDMINDLRANGYDSIIIDRGMSSKKNIINIEDYKLKVIMGMRFTSTIGKQYLSTISREEIFTKECQIELKATKVYAKSFGYMSGRLIVIFNPNIEIAMKEKQMESIKQNRNTQYAGYSLIYTNTDIDDKEVVRRYFAKDIVERSFKQLKGPLSLHPLRVWNLQNVQSHIKICYLAYAILSLLSLKVKNLNMSGVEAIKQLNGGYKVYLEDKANKNVIQKVIALKNVQDAILNAIGVVYK